MWLLLVTTVAIVVWTDAGYLYNPPKLAVSLPNNNYMRNSYNEEEVIKNNVHFRNDYIKNNNAHVHQLTANNNHVQTYGNTGYAGIQRELLNLQSSQNYVTGHLSNGYGKYTEPFTPLNKFNNNQINLQHAVSSSISGGVNVDSVQTSSLSAASTLILPVETGYSNSYASPIYDLNLKSGYKQPLTASGSSNNNNGYQQTYTPSGSAALQNNYGQAFTPIGGNNLKGSFLNAAVFNSDNGGYTAMKPQTSAPLNNGYNPAIQTSAPSNNAYSQTRTSSVGYNVNNGLQNFTPVTFFNSNSGYTQTVLSSVSNQYNSGYSQASAVNLNNGYAQSLTKSGNTNFNSGYGHTSTSSGTNVNNAMVANPIPTTGANSGYSQFTTGPTHIDLSSDLIQTSSTSSTTSGNSFDNSNLNNAFAQKYLKDQVKISSSNTGVTPIIHKHIYFHVPPPEIEEPSKPFLASSPVKKNYKILFIKIPSQDSKLNLIRLQQQMQNAPIEERTLIYVLVKKPESPIPVVLPPPKPSQHEVFFVKYNDSPFDIAARVSEEIDETGSIKSIVPLEPGLVNGQHR